MFEGKESVKVTRRDKVGPVRMWKSDITFDLFMGVFCFFFGFFQNVCDIFV